MTEDKKKRDRSSLLLVDDKLDNLKLLRETLASEGHEISVATNGTSALGIISETEIDLVLLDVSMPGIDGYETCRRIKSNPATSAIPIIFLTGHDEHDSILEGFSAGAVDYVIKPFAAEEVLARVRTQLEMLRLRRSLEEKSRDLEKQNLELEFANKALREEIGRREAAEEARTTADQRFDLVADQEAAHWGVEGLIGKSRTMRRILDEARTLQAAAVSGILITGESGTGKELVARAIHSGETQNKAPFIAVNCGAIPRELAESTLFGHVKGAFTGAQGGHKGYFELATGGTLFLDEIGETPLEIQVKLLRALETRLVRPVGSATEREVDTRVLAATNAALPKQIANGQFREDLYFRLARFTVQVPPLRDRREDIPLLVEHFVTVFTQEMGRPKPQVSEEAIYELKDYRFPGNIRELKNMVESALIRCGSGPLLPEHWTFVDWPEAPGESVHLRPINSEDLPDEETVRRLRLNGEESRILAYIRKYESISNIECRNLLSANVNRASYLLNKLHQRGAVKREGTHRNARYILAS